MNDKHSDLGGGAPEVDTPHNLIKTHHTPQPNFTANFEEDWNISPIPQTTPTTFIRTDTDVKTDGPRNKLENNPDNTIILT